LEQFFRKQERVLKKATRGSTGKARPAANTAEAALFCRAILRSLDQVMACLEGLDERQLNWHPEAVGANSLVGIANHVLTSAEKYLFTFLIEEEPIEPHHEEEFLVVASSAHALHERWRALREQVQSALLALSQEDLEREYFHPHRGSLMGREILLMVTRHLAEHLGQAELTRDLAKMLL
jgi:uncharacterized damage-inducible protein DinB